MKITIILLIATIMQVSATGFAQRVTLNEKKITLDRVFSEIRKQTGYDVLWESEKLKGSSTIDAQFKNASLEEVMNKCLEGKPLIFIIQENTVVIKEKEPSFLDRILDKFNAIDVHGRVVDEEGKPLPGATVRIKLSGKSVSTNAKGEFYFEKVEEGAVLVISFIGYISRELNASKEIGEIVLEVSDSKLDEIQVIAYGTTTQRLSTGNITKIKGEDIQKQPIQNPLLALQGRVPGLMITQSTGYSGTGVTVRIQGQNSIGNNSDPLYVIDGVQYSSQLLPSINEIIGKSGDKLQQYGPTYGNPMNYINPSDIESIEILKDADATAIYGSKAANGAILITTKKGKAGELETTFNLQKGWGEVARTLHLLNTAEYIEMRREALKNDGLTADPEKDYDLFNNYGWSENRNIDWQKVLIGNTAKYNNLSGSLSGGSENVQFGLNAGYKHETAVIPGNFANQKASLNMNLNSASFNKRFKLNFSANFLFDDNRLPDIDLTRMAVSLPPNAPELYNSDGSLNWARNAAGTSTWGYMRNPVANLGNKYKNQTNNLISGTTLSYSLIQGLDLRSTFGYNYLHSDESAIGPLSQFAPEEQPYQARGSRFGTNKSSSWSIEPQLNYRKRIGNLSLDFLAGLTIQESLTNAMRLSATGYSDDNNMNDLSNSTSVRLDFSRKIQYKYNASFGRLNLNWKDKYILNLTGRRDGSSRFGENNLFHAFGSIAGAWIFSEELPLKSLPLLSFGKLRMSYGTTGSDQIGDYRFMNLYTNGFSLPYQDVKGMLPTGLSNPYLQWEETRKLQVGLDLGFTADRVLLSGNYFRNRSSNQLLEYNLPITTGFGSVTSNFGALIQNSGLELTLATENISNKSFKWTSSINLTTAKNKLLSFPDLESSSYSYLLQVGKSLNIKKLFEFAGVNPETGVYQFKNQNGEIIPLPDGLTDKTILVNTDPKVYGGIQNTISYKGFSLDFLFQFVKQTAHNYKFGAFPGSFERTSGNQPIYILDRWKQPDDVKSIQRYNSDYSLLFPGFNANDSDAAYSDASYLRLKTLGFLWQLPESWNRQIHTKRIQVYLQGQNLWTITNYSGMDPETLSSTTLPPLRMLTLGFKVTL